MILSHSFKVTHSHTLPQVVDLNSGQAPAGHVEKWLACVTMPMRGHGQTSLARGILLVDNGERRCVEDDGDDDDDDES